MVLGSVAQLEAVIRECWSERTCDPSDRAEWSPENPARGMTALVEYETLAAAVRRRVALPTG
jgi:hypothetical protein